MKFYIATSHNYIPFCKNFAKELKDRGHTITREWWRWWMKDKPEFKDLSQKDFYAHPQIQFIREIDYLAVDQADIVIGYTVDEYKLTGGMLELGYAKKANKIIFIVGKMKQSTMASGFIHVGSSKELLHILDRIT